MLQQTHIAEALWWVVEADDKRRARLNCMAHHLAQIPYGEVDRLPPNLPARERPDDYERRRIAAELYVPDKY